MARPCVEGSPNDANAMTDALVTILLVDDDKIDAKAVRRSFQASKFDNPVVEARNGIQAMDLLHGENGCEMVPCPFVILLDLDMAGMDGFEFLEKLRSDPNLRRAPVFVMSASESHEDRKRAYNFNIAGFIRKKNPSRSFLKEVQMLQHYIQVTEFPERPSGSGTLQRVAGRDNRWSQTSDIMWNTSGRADGMNGFQSPRIEPVVLDTHQSFEQRPDVEATSGKAFGPLDSIHGLMFPPPSTFHSGIVSSAGSGQSPTTQRASTMTRHFLRDEAARRSEEPDSAEADMATINPNTGEEINEVPDANLGEALKINRGGKIDSGESKETVVARRRPVGWPRRE